MPLRRLELYNFKSYRGTQVIDFGDAPFTCIIGPNGAGKSNLMDAISFVLGVKSAQLRSTQLRDLVYRGRKALQTADDVMDVDETQEEAQTQTQEAEKSKAAADEADARTAWVQAVYEDEKGKEWKFKRSIATSGQSTYFLNSKAVAWTAYNQQLEKLNVLVKAKNFLVFQGDVENVASQDSKAIAKLIDRISGSMDWAPQYEAAKAAQDKATDASTANYAKKRGMQSEFKHFKEQRDEIRQWEMLRDAKDAMIQRHLLWRLYHLTNEITESTRQVEEANEKLTGLRTSVGMSDKKLDSAKKKQAEAQLAVKKIEGRVKKAERAYEGKKPDLVTVNTQIAHAEKKATNASSLAERVEKDEQRQAGNLRELEKGAADIKRSMDDAASKQRQKSQAAGKTLTKADLDQYRDLRSQANTLAVSERQQLETLRRELKNLRDSLASVEDRVSQAERQKAKLSNEIAILADREEEMGTKVQDLEQERERIKGGLDRAQAERTRISLRETEINERLQDTYSQLLQAGVDKRENEREAKLKETLSSLKRVLPGVHGRIVDLCRPTASRYEKAVMTVLGRNIDAVVVEHEKTAIECIEQMRNSRAGQATFIPLDTIQVKPVPERLRTFKGARLAIDCIQFDPQFERAMQHACGNTVICDSLEVARYICYEKTQEVKAVTIDGTIIHRSGNMTGGQGQSGGRKFDDQQVEGLKNLKETYLKQLRELNQAKPKNKADEGLLESLARLNAEHSIAKDDLDATKLRLNGLREELKHVDADLRKLSPDKDKRLKAVRDSEATMSGLANTINSADDGVFTAFCQRIRVANIREYEDVQLKMAREESEAMDKFSQQQARVSHQMDFEKAQLDSTRVRLASLRTTVQKAQAEVETLQAKKASVEEELEALMGEIDSQKAKLADKVAAQTETSTSVDEARDAARKTQRSLDKALKEIANWNDEIEKSASDRHAIYRRCRLEEIELPLASGDLEKVPVEEAQDVDMEVDDEDGTQRPAKAKDYGIEPDFDVLEEDDIENGGEDIGRDFEAQINRMKGELEKLVPNMKAIDRLADVETGLEEAEQEAEQTRRESKRAKDEFQELRKKRCDLFNKAFNHMSGCIDRIYKDLTKGKTNNTEFPSGGVGFLSLEDAEEPYLGGVRYNVMPPGKRFVEMDQLSGGEKTMAALALLFAIHSFHPAPFFVLDEVDAALDPTNVSKLARYVRDAARGVQFLIISLKSTLYEKADGLVGVYREQEDNSSRILTLDLRKYAE